MILVTGGSGLLGKSLQKILEAKYLSSEDCDLRRQSETEALFQKYKPEFVVHLAGRVGGIVGNSNNQYDYYYENLMINTNVLNCCVQNKVKYAISMAGTCMYPENHPALPLAEDMIHMGAPHSSNKGYSYAKRMIQVQMECVQEQYGLKWGLFLPGNLYGPHDNFDLNSGHVVASLLRRIHEAKVNDYPTVECYGTGRPLRQFTYVDDVAQGIKQALIYEVSGTYNICNQENQSISDLVNVIVSVVGYKGDIIFNQKLDGVMRKESSDSKLQSRIKLKYTTLKDGLERTYKWYLDQQEGAV